MTKLLLILSFIIVFGCGEAEPYVNWQDYPSYVKTGIKNSIREKSFDGLMKAWRTTNKKLKFDDTNVNWMPVSRYILFHT